MRRAFPVAPLAPLLLSVSASEGSPPDLRVDLGNLKTAPAPVDDPCARAALTATRFLLARAAEASGGGT